MNDAALVDPPTPSSVNHFELTRERSHKTVNRFLERVHPRGDVAGWKACFGARYEGHLVACIVLSRPSARMLDDGSVVEITRFGIRDDRPANTGSWLISRARMWCELEGFDRLIAYAGVSGNKGITYQAAGFECRDKSIADGSGWTNRTDRDEWEDYERRRYEYDLDGANLIE